MLIIAKEPRNGSNSFAFSTSARPRRRSRRGSSPESFAAEAKTAPTWLGRGGVVEPRELLQNERAEGPALPFFPQASAPEVNFKLHPSGGPGEDADHSQRTKK